jgi:hypothetical protein
MISTWDQVDPIFPVRYAVTNMTGPRSKHPRGHSKNITITPARRSSQPKKLGFYSATNSLEFGIGTIFLMVTQPFKIPFSVSLDLVLTTTFFDGSFDSKSCCFGAEMIQIGVYLGFRTIFGIITQPHLLQ